MSYAHILRGNVMSYQVREEEIGIAQQMQTAKERLRVERISSSSFMISSQTYFLSYRDDRSRSWFS